jgi:hypothetical protein
VTVKGGLSRRIDERYGLKSKNIYHGAQGKAVINFRSKETLRNDNFYLGLRPTVDTALIPLCHTCFSKENQVLTYMHARIKFHAYSDI